MRVVVEAGSIRLLEQQRTLIIGRIERHHHRRLLMVGMALISMLLAATGLALIATQLTRPTPDQAPWALLTLCTAPLCGLTAWWLSQQPTSAAPLASIHLNQRTISWPANDTPIRQVTLIHHNGPLLQQLWLRSGDKELKLGSAGPAEDLGPIRRMLGQLGLGQ